MRFGCDAVIRFVLLEKLFETSAVGGVQRVHLLARRMLAAIHMEWRADDSRDGSCKRHR